MMALTRNWEAGPGKIASMMLLGLISPKSTYSQIHFTYAHHCVIVYISTPVHVILNQCLSVYLCTEFNLIGVQNLILVYINIKVQ